MNINYQIIQELKADFLNLAHCWLYAILYYYQVYPKHTFQFRTVYGVSTPVTSSPKLKDYVQKLFKDFQTNLFSINYLQIELVIDTKPTITYRLSPSFSQNDYYNNRHQKQTELKYFINQFIKKMQEIAPQGENRTFNFYIDYRYDGTDKFKGGKFIDKWILNKQNQTEELNNQQLVGSSLKLSELNVIFTKYRQK